VFYPEIARRLDKFVLYDSRAPRPGEVDGVDYHFRSRSEIEALRGRDDFIVFEVRNDLQALDVGAFKAKLETSDVFVEGNPFIGSRLRELARSWGVECLSVFLAPLAKEEIVELKLRQPSVDLPGFVCDMMRRKLLRRTQRQKGILSLADLENIEVRAASAFGEMQTAWRFDHVVPNHDGEDSENWNAFYYPIADARKTMRAFAALLAGESTTGAETWEQELLG
jgi:guanylate kinase